MRGNIWYLSETDLICLIWLSLAASIFLQRTYLYYSWLKNFHCVHKTFFNPSVVWFRLVPQLVCRELCYNKHGHIRIYKGIWGGWRNSSGVTGPGCSSRSPKLNSFNHPHGSPKPSITPGNVPSSSVLQDSACMLDTYTHTITYMF